MMIDDSGCGVGDDEDISLVNQAGVHCSSIQQYKIKQKHVYILWKNQKQTHTFYLTRTTYYETRNHSKSYPTCRFIVYLCKEKPSAFFFLWCFYISLWWCDLTDLFYLYFSFYIYHVWCDLTALFLLYFTVFIYLLYCVCFNVFSTERLQQAYKIGIRHENII